MLQSLLLLGPDRVDIWQALEAVANRAVMLAQDGAFVGDELIGFAAAALNSVPSRLVFGFSLEMGLLFGSEWLNLFGME